jgi:bifunctional non-homologous end joining protein LigD
MRPVSGFVEPCLPSACRAAPSGNGWLHEIKHDGYRLMVWRVGDRVWLYTRNGHDWADRFPGIVAAALSLKAERFLIDGEVIVAGSDGRAVFELLRRGRQVKPAAFLCAFDLIVIADEDLRATPLEQRKARLARLLDRAGPGLQVNPHIDGVDGAAVFQHACELGYEGIVSKRKGSRYRSGRSPHWLKSKNPASAAAIREATEDWSR